MKYYVYHGFSDEVLYSENPSYYGLVEQLFKVLELQLRYKKQ